MKTKEFVEFQFRYDLRSWEVMDWCEKNIGRRGTHWEVSFGLFQTGIFEFNRKEDASYFTLKWR